MVSLDADQLTLEQAKELQYGEVLIFVPTGNRWRVNGKPKFWVTRLSEVRVPIKHGLFAYSYLTHDNLYLFHKEG